MANELKVPEINDAVRVLNSTLQKKLDDLKLELSQYDGNVVTAENEAYMKKVRADLNKERLIYDRERKDIVKAWKNQVTPIEATYKDIDSEFMERINAIDVQTAELEDERKAEKLKLISEAFERIKAEKGGNVSDWITLEGLKNPSWLNKTYKLSDIEQEIEDAYWNLNQDYKSIVDMGHPYEEQGLNILKATRDYRGAVQKMNELKRQEELIAERRRAEEERRIREAEERARRQAEAEARARAEAERQKIIEEERARARAEAEKAEAESRAMEEAEREARAMDSVIAELPPAEEEPPAFELPEEELPLADELPPIKELTNVEELPPIEELPAFEEEFPLRQFRVTMIVEAEDYDNFLMMLEQSQIGAVVESFEEV